MLKRALVAGVVICCMICLNPLVFAGEHGMDAHTKAKEKKAGILLVTFGTSIPEAQKAFGVIQKRVKGQFPDTPVRWAYTSHIIREKLEEQGKELDSPVMALAKMRDEGFTHIAVQSLHMIGGFEYHDVLNDVHAFRGTTGFKSVYAGYPLLGSPHDLDRVVDATLDIIPDKRKKSEAVVLMGHGTHHPANAFYEAMMYRFQKADPNIYIGTVEGSPSFETIKEMLIKKEIQKAYLIPFMSVAGDHARNDMAGEGPDSWLSMLTKEGITCIPVLKGLAEHPVFVDIWVEHLKGAMNHIN